ncbi:MAG: Fic family protein [Burkholderiales bacterium]|nr:Fic family protein [Burkholderiales bacterium]
MFNLEGTPYLLDPKASEQVRTRLDAIEERVSLLRRNGMLTEQTVKDYYGEKRFEQVAESNAIEGSTLSAGETELAVLKGITITGHDPAYTKDAMALDRALTRITELARDTEHPTDIPQLHEVHALLLGDRAGAGIFRKERVTIRGARHTPPKTWEQIMTMMTDWQSWSAENITLPAPIRSAVLHAWLTHVHPFIDGNGRISRAIGNLELIRAGYPPIIIKKKERDRYIEALAESDEGGDIRSFLELIFDRIEGGLTGLELSAKRRQGFNPVVEKIRQLQEKQLYIWETGVKLLASIIGHRLTQLLEPVGGAATIRLYDSPLDLDDYQEVCGGRSVSRSWAFTVRIEIPGVARLEKLAYISHRSNRMYQAMNLEGGPSLYWSSKNPANFPKWLADGENSPFAMELTAKVGNGDEWIARLADDSIARVQTTELATKIADALVGQVGV